MSDRYPGGLIRKTPPTITPPVDGEGGSASGIWTMDQVAYYIKEGTWPQKVLSRELYAWGAGIWGTVGENNNVYRSSPVQVASGTSDWNLVQTGRNASFAVRKDNTLWAWGRNEYGELGHNDTIARSSPVQVGALTTWERVFGGNQTTLALKTDGTLWTWGKNNEGQVGDVTQINRSSPVQIASGISWAGGHDNGSAYVKTDGTLWTWGYNTGGWTGLNEPLTRRSSPTQVGALTNWDKVSLGSSNQLMSVKTDNTVWVCGANNSGILGQNNTISYSSPVQIGALTTWSQVFQGGGVNLLLKSDNTLWVSGSSTFGGTGLNDTINRSSPTQIGGADWASIGGGDYTPKAIKTDGTLWSWGYNTQGSVGNNSTAQVSSPVQIGALTTWSQISNGGSYNFLGLTKG